MLRRFEIHRCETVAEVCTLRRELGPEAAIYAGGTELLLAMKMGLGHWPHLLDVKNVLELKGVELDRDLLVVGAAVTHHELEQNPTVVKRLPALAALERQVANIRVRVAGTLGGNVAFAEPHADPPALLVALGARVRLQGSDSRRVVALSAFLVGAYETALGADEVITAIEIPLPAPDVRISYRNFRVLERPTVGVAAVARIEDGRLEGEPTLVMGAINDVPVRLAVEGLAGLEPGSKEAAATVGQAARAAADPAPDLAGSADYKTHIAGVTAARALASLVG